MQSNKIKECFFLFSLQWVARCSEQFGWCQWGTKCYFWLLCWGDIFWCLCCIYLSHRRACPSHLFCLFGCKSNNHFPWGREAGDLCSPQGPLNNQVVKTDGAFHCSLLPSLAKTATSETHFPGFLIIFFFFPNISFGYLQWFFWPLNLPPTFLLDFSVLGTHIRLCGGQTHFAPRTQQGGRGLASHES